MTDEEVRLLEASIDAARPDVDDLLVEVKRLHALVLMVEWRGSLDGYQACPWCQAVERTHANDCPAFSAPGVLR